MLAAVPLPNSMLDDNFLCPLDDRYLQHTRELRAYFSVAALHKARLYVQTSYLIALSDQEGVAELMSLSTETRQALDEIVESFDAENLAEIRAIEADINHDVKATEYFLQRKIQQRNLPIPVNFIRFGVTSEDDTNLAWGLLINEALEQSICPKAWELIEVLGQFVSAHQSAWMLGMTHGQPATPISIGDRVRVFEFRLRQAVDRLDEFEMNGKFGGAVGNMFAHRAAYPEVDWIDFRNRFVESLGLCPVPHTTQINPHEDLACLAHLMSEINTILIDLCQNVWLYISRGVFCQKSKAEEVGSSVMPHKVNPQDWETAEGSLTMSNAIFNCLAQELPKSRMERHLSDSHLQRWLGTAFGGHLLAVIYCLKGLRKLEVNAGHCAAELAEHPEVFSEVIQTVMRRYGHTDAYEQLKELTRGKVVTAEELIAFVDGLERVPGPDKERLCALLRGDLSALTK